MSDQAPFKQGDIIEWIGHGSDDPHIGVVESVDKNNIHVRWFVAAPHHYYMHGYGDMMLINDSQFVKKLA